MNRKCVCKGPRTVKKRVTLTVAGEGLASKEVKVHKETVSNTERILEKRKAAFEALSKY